MYKYIITALFLSLFYSCEEPLSEGIEGAIICDKTDLEISESDNIVIADSSNPVLWEGSYNDTTIKINFTKDVGVDGETETMTFDLTKVGDCLQVDRAYKYYYGSYGDISAVTQMYILDFYITEWVIDEKFTGQVSYRDHHDKQIYTYNFWVEFTEDDYEVEDTNYSYFSDCFLNQLPIDLDLNNDGTIDYSILAEVAEDTGNTPQFTSYTIKLVSMDEDINEILSPNDSSIPYPVIFEPPFTSQNTKKYDANRLYSEDVNNALDVFYEFASPYESYNYFLQNNLTNKKEFANNKDDYYVIKMTYDDNSYYGWIKIDFSATDCYIEVLDTYLNPTPNEHISIEN